MVFWGERRQERGVVVARGRVLSANGALIVQGERYILFVGRTQST